MFLKSEELASINGGAFSATLLNAFSRAATTLLKIGQTLGSSIRRLFSKNYC